LLRQRLVEIMHHFRAFEIGRVKRSDFLRAKVLNTGSAEARILASGAKATVENPCLPRPARIVAG